MSNDRIKFLAKLIADGVTPLPCDLKWLVEVAEKAKRFLDDVKENMDWRTHDATSVSGPEL